MLLKKKRYNAQIKNFVDKVPDVPNLATNTFLNARINEFKGKISSVTKLATTAALNVIING